MIPVHGFAASQKRGKAVVSRYTFSRSEPKDNDLLIDIMYCGICHSDLEMLHDNWNLTKYPCVPGHEIIGRVASTASSVTKFQVGDIVGIGNLVDSCLDCIPCKEGWENHCEGPNGPTLTYGGYLFPGSPQATKYNTYGGWSNQIVVREEFVVAIPPEMSLASAAPLMCPGTATFGPLRRFGDLVGKHIAILGCGGPGHLALQFAKAMGAAHVAIVTTHGQKKEDALLLGADQIIISTDGKQMHQAHNQFHFVLSTIPVSFDLARYLPLLRRRGTITVMGLLGPYKTVLNNLDLAARGLTLTGSMIGSVRETDECIEFCRQHSITPIVEIIKPSAINHALARLETADVRFRFVIDMQGSQDVS